MTTPIGASDNKDAAAMLDSLPERVVRYRVPDLVITYCNSAWAAQYNLAPGEALGHPLDQFLSTDGRAGLEAQLALLGPHDLIRVDSVARAAPNAPGRWVEWVDQYIPGDDGDEILAVGRDVTGRHEAEVKLADSEARFHDLADKTADVVWHFVLRPYPHFDYMSPSVQVILGYSPEFFLDDFRRFLDILDDEGKALVNRALQGDPMPERFDLKYRRADGVIRIGETQTTLLRGGLQGVGRDVTELRRLQDNMAALALRDPLTGLANRRLFQELLKADLARTQRSALPLVVAYLDLDGLKDVNDNYGHDAGDLVLCETARRLVSAVRRADIVARLGGDEFAVVHEPNDPTSLDLVDRLDRALRAPICVSPTVWVSCPASIGVADTRTSGYDAADLIAVADEAMYDVKRARQDATASTR